MLEHETIIRLVVQPVVIVVSWLLLRKHVYRWVNNDEISWVCFVFYVIGWIASSLLYEVL